MPQALWILVWVLWATNAAVAGPAATQPGMRDTLPDTWAATDALGRTVADHDQVGPPRAGKHVGIFYFLWLGQHGTDGPYDVSRILAQEPGALLNPASSRWGPQHHYHHWGEPLFGYYLSDDAWVIARHAQMLSDAGVDTLVFDVTNQITYEKVYLRLCQVFTELRGLGRRTPQIAFLCPFGDPAKVAFELYEKLYRPERYADLWFRWKGKPLLLADPAKVAPQLRGFFTLRKPQPDYFQGPTGPDQWGWLEIHPQHAFYNRDQQPEQMTVGVGQNASGRRLCAFSEKNTYGRSWHNGRMDDRPEAVLEGLNFAEQWERALKIDPEFIFITGWNEWIAMRLPEFNRVREPVMFVDQFTQECSRDVEPMRGGHGDNYYYQMVHQIRRFKGARRPPAVTGAGTIRVDGDFSDWSGAGPEFRDDPGDTRHRDHPGYDGAGRYVNNSGRNDLVAMKVSFDEDSVCFYVQTADAITPPTDPNWMLLFLNADGDPRTGWEGFEFIVNRRFKDGRTSILERSTGAWDWKAETDVPFRAAGKEMELAVPRHALRPAVSQAGMKFTFKWADNLQTPGDPMDFTLSGDTAPNGRFAYRFE